MPLILHPQGLPRHHTPWELLKWKRAGERLTVHNDSAYVVRLAPDVQVFPQGVPAILPRTYILPGEVLAAEVGSPLGSVTEVEIQPATVYGFTVDHYRAPIVTDGGDRLMSNPSSQSIAAYFWPCRPTLIIGFATLWSLPVLVSALELGEGFDLASLTAHGIDPKVSDYFRNAARFREGVQVVGLRVNGNPLGLVDARFGHEGRLCFTPGLLEKAGLVTPGTIIQEGATPDQSCHDFLGAFPTTMVKLRPGTDEVTLVVPTQSLRDPQWDAGHFSKGGAAALFNYDVLGFDSRSRSAPSRFVSAYTEAGFNLEDWIVRSRQFYVSDNGKARTEHVYAYAQRDIAALQSTFQVGQISSHNPLFGGVQLSGLQFFPDGQSRVAVGSNNAVVEGLAQSQSRIEVRQSGVLIHSTLVPEGPFRLTGLPLLNGTSDLEVSVIDVRGARRSFVVPAASFAGAAPAAPGYYFSVGKLRKSAGEEGPSPVVAMGSGTWGLGRNSSAGFGLLSTDEYWSAGGTLSSVFFQRVSVAARQNLSRDGKSAVSGARSSVSVSSPVYANIDVNLSATSQTRGYREVLEAGRSYTADELGSRFKNQYTASLSWADPTLGVFSAGYTHGSQFDGRTTEHVSASWNKSFSHADVALIADSQVGGTRMGRDATLAGERNERAVEHDLSLRLQVSVPLGRDRRLNSYASRRGDRFTAGTALSERVNESVNYEVGSSATSMPESNRCVAMWIYCRVIPALAWVSAVTPWAPATQGSCRAALWLTRVA